MLSGNSPREILARVLDGDPLRLRSRCEERVRAQAILLDVHRLHLRTAAHVARSALSYRGTPPIDVWIAEKVRRSVSELLEEAAERAHAGDVVAGATDPVQARLADLLGIEPLVLQRGLVAFNRAPYGVRSAFQALVVEGQSLASWCADNSTAPAPARAALRRAFWALGVREELDLETFVRDGEEEEAEDE